MGEEGVVNRQQIFSHMTARGKAFSRSRGGGKRR